ncbi:hypothetical protein HPK19_04180 [Arthrobacter citreus]|nr:hypothetical protein HPK19_04180 [Arthrobacter citreus]
MNTKNDSFIKGYLKVTKFLYRLTKYATFIAYIGTTLIAFFVATMLFSEMGEKTILAAARLGIHKNNYSAFNFKLINFSFSTQFIFIAVTNTLLITNLNQILKNVMEQKPFIYQNANRIRMMGWLLLVQALIGYIYDFIQDLVLLKHRVSFELLYSEVPLLLFGVCLLILSGVFRYGCYLQEEYDAIL